MTQFEFDHRLVSLYNNMEYYAKMLTPNRDEAKDLVQETYYKALTNREKFSEDINLKAWVYTIMKNTFINDYRKNQKINRVIDNSEDFYLLNNLCKSEFPSPESSLSEKQIKRTISCLGKDQRLPFEMYHSGYKYIEIADCLKISIGTVKSRIFFTRRKLKDSLRDFAY